MKPACSTCGEEMDIFHNCDTQSSRSDSFLGESNESTRTLSLAIVVALAPLLGVILDLFLPLPSSLLHSILISILGSTIVAAVWVATSYKGKKSWIFYLRNLKNFVFTPQIMKVFSTDNTRKSQLNWFTTILISSSIQVLVFTPGNSSYLERQVSGQIDESSGANLQVECPSNIIYLYNNRIECRVKTGILGITVPARAQLSPLVGSADIKVSLV